MVSEGTATPRCDASPHRHIAFITAMFGRFRFEERVPMVFAEDPPNSHPWYFQLFRDLEELATIHEFHELWNLSSKDPFLNGVFGASASKDPRPPSK